MTSWPALPVAALQGVDNNIVKGRRRDLNTPSKKEIEAAQAVRAAAFLIPSPNGYYVNEPPRCNPVTSTPNCTKQDAKQVCTSVYFRI